RIPDEGPTTGSRRAALDATAQSASAAMTSPPAGVSRARSTSELIMSLRNRTEPSKNIALKPPGWGEPTGGGSAPGRAENGRPPGRVQGADSSDSKTATVLLNPSTISRTLMPCGPG